MPNYSRKIKLAGGRTGKYLYQGIHAFATTGLTKTVTCPFGRIESFGVQAIGAVGTVPREVNINLGTLSATGEAIIIAPGVAGSISAAQFVVKTTVAADDTNYWTFRLINKGNADADMILATDANTTKLTGGAALTGYTARSLGLHATPANLVIAASTVLFFTATKTASGANLVDTHLKLGFACGDPGESLTVNNTVSGTAGNDDAVIVGSNGSTDLTVTRAAGNPTSGLKFAIWAIGW